MPMSLDLDKTVLEVKVEVRKNLVLEGKNILVGIIDSGIDYTHPDFRNPDGSSRILYLWDQNQKLDVLPQSAHGHDPPRPFNYGREYKKQEIETAFKSADPFVLVPQRDILGHGTHVAGIIAGNGHASSGRYVGMAPASNILFVKYWLKKEIGDSNTLIDALTSLIGLLP